MSQTPASTATSPDRQQVIDQLTQGSIAQLRATASAGGSAEYTPITDDGSIQGAHPYAANLVDLSTPIPEAVVEALPTTIGPFGTNYITFNDGIPVGGYASLTLHSDGTCEFSGHFHDSGAPSYDVELVWVIADSAGNAYTFTASGKVHGTFESGSRDFNWNQTKVNPAVAQHWAQLCAGWRYQWTAHVNWDVAAAVESVVNGLKAAGAVISAVIDVIAIFA